MASRTAKALCVLLFALLATIANAASTGYREPDQPLPAAGPIRPCGPGVGGAGCTPPNSVRSMIITNTGTGPADVVVTYKRTDGQTEQATGTIAAGASQVFARREYQGAGETWTSVMEIVSVQVSSVGGGNSIISAPFSGVTGITEDYKLEIKGVPAPAPAPTPLPPVVPCVGTNGGCTPPARVNSMVIFNTGTASADVVVTYKRADGKTETAVATIAAGASQSFGIREYQVEGQTWTSVMEIVSVQFSSVGGGVSNVAAPFPGVNGVTVDYKLVIKGVPAPTPAPAPAPVSLPPVVPCVGTNGGCTPPARVNSMVISNTGTASADVVVTYKSADGKTETAVATIAAGASQSFGIREYQGEGQTWTSVMEIVSVQVSSVGAGVSNIAAPFPGVNGVTVDYKLEIKGVPTPAPAPIPVPPVVPCVGTNGGCTPPARVNSMVISNTGTASADVVVTYKRADGKTETAVATLAAGASQSFGIREYQGEGQTWTSVMEIVSVQFSSVGGGVSNVAAPFPGVNGVTVDYKLVIKGVPTPTPAPAPAPVPLPPVVPCVGTNGGCTPPARVNSMVISNTGTASADVVVTYKRADGKTETAVATLAAGASQSFGIREYQGEGQTWTSVMEIVSVQFSSVGGGVSNVAAPFPGVNGVTVDYKLEIKGFPAPTPMPEPNPITPCVGSNGACRPPTYVKGATIFNRSGRTIRLVAVYSSTDGKKSERQVSVVAPGQSAVFAPREWQENGATFTQVLPLAHITVAIDGQRTGRRYLAPFGTSGITEDLDLTVRMAGARLALARGKPASTGY